ncbi:sugar phosphate isomerase/epimerase family protein [Virgibacillus sp. W0181]|uniref:sugar phosphate isomerase/epimerase family protein n=1 Tax=Virgibacillus sp. W0181 TaxID=3391581 RepID=UPI003F44C8FA
MENILCLNSNTYHGFTIDEAIEGAARSGYSYIELAAVRGYTEHVLPEMSDEELKEVKEKLKENGIECIALAGHSNLMTEEGIENFSKNIDLAKRLGCKFIVTATGETHDDDTEIDDEKVVVNTLKALSKKCEENGLTLVVETHGNNYATGNAVKALGEKVNSSHFGTAYDTANVIFYGDVMPYDDLEQSIDSVKHIHLKDKLGSNNELNFPAIGKGYLDMERIFSMLKDKGCKAPISVEVEFTMDGSQKLEEVHEAVDYSYQTVRKLLSK